MKILRQILTTSIPFLAGINLILAQEKSSFFATKTEVKSGIELISGNDDHIFLGEDNEWLATYAKKKLETAHYDYFVFGHRHLPMTIPVGLQSTYFNIGDWITHYTYGVFDGERFDLKTFKATTD